MNIPLIHNQRPTGSRLSLKGLSSRRRSLKKLAAAAVVTAMTTVIGCSPMHNSHGYIPDEELVAKLRPGVHDRDSVASLFGSPTSIAKFNGETWLYVKRESEQLAFFNEEVMEQDVLAIRFNKAGVVSEIKRYAMADGRILIPVERKTPTRGKEMTVLEQLFGNLGRFNGQ